MTSITPYLMDAPFSRGRDLRADLLPIFAGGVALAVVVGFGFWLVSPSSPPVESPSVAAVERPSAPAIVRPVGNPFGDLVTFAGPQPELRRVDPNGYGSLVASFPDSAPAAADASPSPDAPLGPSRSLGPLVATIEAAPAAIAEPSSPALLTAPLPPRREVASIDDSTPLPPARPSQFAAVESPAPDKALGPSRSIGPLAYAAPDTATSATPPSPAKTSIFSIFSPQPTRPAGYDDHTAVYDISAKALYMPDGVKIEAHSGLGEYMDDPNHVNERLRGATPPDLYDLQPRESLFHGIAAIRLVPVGGEEAIYGRAGLLAHPFMMGDNGDSNGCVSIKDYDAFLKAFQDGKVTRLAVVAKL